MYRYMQACFESYGTFCFCIEAVVSIQSLCVSIQSAQNVPEQVSGHLYPYRNVCIDTKHQKVSFFKVLKIVLCCQVICKVCQNMFNLFSCVLTIIKT